MNLDKSKEFREIIKLAKKDKNIIALILFGSYAKGIQKPNSDIDLCIIGKRNKLPHEFSILEYQSKKFDILFYKNLPDYIKFRVYSEGKILVINDEKVYFKIRKLFLHKFRGENFFRLKQLNKMVVRI